MEQRGGDPTTEDRTIEDRPPRRALLVAVLAVIVLVCVGMLVAKGLLDMSKLQDCALAGRRDC